MSTSSARSTGTTRPGGHSSGGHSSGGAASGGAARAAGIGLWVIVGAGLAYGVTQTAIKVAALFG